MVINNESRSLYLNMIFGTIGMILVGLGMIRYFTLIYDIQGYGLSIIGYSLTNGYIFYLEKKAGISNKIIWVQSAVGITALAVTTYIFYM
ncbi:hypothetical protein E3U55_14740 [Filobacillus milosensis]|uniref:DUF4181 domain-containing protein n=1 Tax=Filobacillus milosensis TaxID=94137 RepID=A0A4Y8IDH9_9BACI|nr:hypothetical protein [Filobacillus milosensis]TFB14038.1 hypothetical protein E3U55_14740 [Filobacillus milosensis]